MASSPTLRPEPGRERLRRDHARSATSAPCTPAAPLAQPRDAGPLPAGLDVQGRHRGGRARHRRATRPTRRSTTRATASSTASRSQLRRPERARGLRPRRRSSQALQHSINAVFCNIGKELGARDDPRLREALRLLPTPPLETPVERARAERPLQRTARLFDPNDPNQVDPGRLAFGQERLLRHAAADGDGRRGDRERRRA